MGNCEKGCFFSFVALFLEVFFLFGWKFWGVFFCFRGKKWRDFDVFFSAPFPQKLVFGVFKTNSFFLVVIFHNKKTVLYISSHQKDRSKTKQNHLWTFTGFRVSRENVRVSRQDEISSWDFHTVSTLAWNFVEQLRHHGVEVRKMWNLPGLQDFRWRNCSFFLPRCRGWSIVDGLKKHQGW